MAILKILIYLKSDGFLSTARLIFDSIRRMFYYHSETFFLRSNFPTSADVILPKGYDICIFNRDEQLDELSFPRLKLLPYKKWFANKSNLVVVWEHQIPIAYAWIHKKEYHIHGLGTVQLKDNEFWIGPTFVNKRFRGKGINKLQLQYIINKVILDSRNNCCLVTSVNSKNIPSLKSFLHLGFQKIGTYSIYCGILTFRDKMPQWKYDNNITDKIVLER